MQQANADGVARVEFTDRAVKPGDRWGYALGIATAEGEVLSPDNWVDVPIPELTFSAPTPNPTAGRFDLVAVLPQAGPLRIVIYDIGGRVCAVRELALADAGTHHLAFDLRASASAGIYFARLSAGSHVITHRFAIVR